MRLFENKSVYYAGTGKWEEVFLIDGENVPADVYQDEQYKEKIILDSKLKETIKSINDSQECCGCSECCEGCDCDDPIEDLLNVYADIILDDGDCRDCIYDTLKSFVGDILECFEDSEEFECECEDMEIDEDMSVDIGGVVIKFTRV